MGDEVSESTIESPSVHSRILNACLTCIASIFLLMGVVLVVCTVSYVLVVIVPDLQAQNRMQANKTTWLSKGPSSYLMTIKTGGGLDGEGQMTVYVKNGDVHLLDAHGGIYYWMKSSFTPQDSTIDALFEEAAGCTPGIIFSCSVEYDPVLGYPQFINHECVDCTTAWTIVIELRLNPQLLEF